MKILVLLGLVASTLLAQGVRVDPTPALTVSASKVGGYAPVLAIPGTTISVCGSPAVGMPCTNHATTYMDASLGATCPVSAPVVLAGTTSCTNATDGQGNFGFWLAVGNYTYTETLPNGRVYGPFPVTAGAGLSSLVYNQGSTGAVNRTLTSKFQDRLSAKDFGAKGDGITDDLASLNSAIAAAASTASDLYLPLGVYMISGPLNIPVGMSQRSIIGSGGSTYVKALPSFSGGTSMVTSAPTLADLMLENIIFDASGVTGITSAVLNLTCFPENSNQFHLRHVQIANTPSGTTSINLDGCEDSTIEDSFVAVGNAQPGYAVQWNVPGGNLHIFGSTFFQALNLQYQTADITGTTAGGINMGSTAWSLVLNGAYLYPSTIGGHIAHFFQNSTNNNPNNIQINGSFLNPGAYSTSTFPIFYGVYNGTVLLNATTIDAVADTGYTVVGSGTTAYSGTYPTFILKGSPVIGVASPSLSIGTPGSNVSISQSTQPQVSFIQANFGGSNPPVQNGPLVPVTFPMRITRITAQSTNVVNGCTTSAAITSVGAAGLTLTGTVSSWDSGPISVPVSTAFNVNVQTQAVGCSTFPTNVSVVLEIQPQ